MGFLFGQTGPRASQLGLTMTFVYSRDSLARPLRILCGMLRDIRTGRFRPDEIRSGLVDRPELIVIKDDSHEHR